MEENKSEQSQQIQTEDTPVFSPKARQWAVKIFFIIVALVLYQLPIYMIEDLSSERRTQSLAVQEQIVNAWGDEQLVSLSQPASSEKIVAEVTPEIRYRGIYQFVVYTSKIKFNTEYKALSSARDCTIVVADHKGVCDVSVTINGKNVKVGDDLKFQLPQGDSKCEILLTLRGSQKLLISPNYGNSTISITGTWDSPGFIGSVLPSKRTIDDKNFSAEWNFNKFSGTVKNVGVELCISAGTYQQVERCFNYATFFLIVFFFAMLIAELITKTGIHTMQYIIAAAAPVLFYLLTLAFAEKIGFTAAYVVSSAIIVIMITAYAKMFLRKTIPAIIMGAVFAGSYLINFVILRMEEWALLTGTIVLTIILGLVMFISGKINQDDKNNI